MAGLELSHNSYSKQSSTAIVPINDSFAISDVEILELQDEEEDVDEIKNDSMVVLAKKQSSTAILSAEDAASPTSCSPD